MYKAMLNQSRLIFGCGNPLFGDDGFGSEVIQFLENLYTLPPDVAFLDVGTAIRDFLFDILLLPKRPLQIIIIDAMEIPGEPAGQIREIGVDAFQPAKISDFSLHQFPTVNLLKEIRNYTDIDVRVLVAQPKNIPDRVKPGLSPAVRAAVPKMCERIMSIIEPGDAATVRFNQSPVHFCVGQLAKQLNVHRNTIRNWIKSGKLMAQPTVGRKYAVKHSELMQLFQRYGQDERAVQDMI
jgi:coenzyme F420 hydrogenase subunit delta